MRAIAHDPAGEGQVIVDPYTITASQPALSNGLDK